MTEVTGARSFHDGAATRAAPPRAIGAVTQVSGSGSQMALNLETVSALTNDPDSAIAAAGQIGSQVKIRAGGNWLIANVRAVCAAPDEERQALATIDFLGEAEEDRATGGLRDFRRGVTRYPMPATPVYPLSTADLRRMYAADDRAHIEIGTVYPTADIRAALQVDAMLGKHFALLGSTGTGKSTAAALILHRICELAPQGHIVMIDPHGEYAAAFAGIGALYDVSNLQMP